MTDKHSLDPDPTEPTEPTVWEFLVLAIRRGPKFVADWLHQPEAIDDGIDGAPVDGFPLRGAEALSSGSNALTPSGEPEKPVVSYHVERVPAEGGAAMHVEFSVTLPPGTILHIDLAAENGSAEDPVIVNAHAIDTLPYAAGRAAGFSPWRSALAQNPFFVRLQNATRPLLEKTGLLPLFHRWNLAVMLFALALIVYLITHSVGLLEYPIYFFSDEAMQPLFAERLARNHFVDRVNNIWFPVYVEVDGNRWAPLLPMYLHVITMNLFGKTALVTRATSAIFSILAAISVSMILKQIFQARFWWIGVLLLAVMPTWFLHSRTAFETVIATSLYAAFLWLYLRYRTGSPRAIFPAAVCAAAAFYSYSNAQAILGVTAILLFLTDLPYHWQQRRWLLWLIPLGLILALPLLGFEWRNPGAIGLHLRTVDSYWFYDISLTEKLKLLVQKYLYGISPLYWFLSNGKDLERHRMGAYPHILTVFLPFFLAGLVVCLRKIRSAPHRIVLLTILAAPVGAAQLDIGVLRVLTFVIPACLLIALGWEWLWQFVQRRWPQAQKPNVARSLQWLVFYALAFGSLWMLVDALKSGPLWSRNYGLYGMQYGAVQLFEQEIPRFLNENPNVDILLSPTWANGTDRFAEFLLTPAQQAHIFMGNIDGYLFRKQDRLASLLLIMTPEEFVQAQTNPKLALPMVEKIINYPDGSPGFYFVRWRYSPEADAIFAAEKAARMQLKEDAVQVNGQPATVRYSWNDMGSPPDMFDGDRYTLMRSLEANPMVVELDFQQPTGVGGISVDFGAQDTTITATLTLDGSAAPLTFTQTYLGVGDPQELTLLFGETYAVTKMHLEFYSLYGGEEVHIHVREIKLLP
ncbi:MAG: ArnT family glycosyltransferase [Chloroflexota bacterium]